MYEKVRTLTLDDLCHSVVRPLAACIAGNVVGVCIILNFPFLNRNSCVTVSMSIRLPSALLSARLCAKGTFAAIPVSPRAAEFFKKVRLSIMMFFTQDSYNKKE